MGSLYCQQICANGYPNLSAPALRVLMRMASVVLDYDNPDNWELEGIYFGGWKALAPCLGAGVFDHATPLPRAVEQRIWRAIKELRDAELLVDVPKVIQDRHPRNRVYRLNISGLDPAGFTWE